MKRIDDWDSSWELYMQALIGAPAETENKDCIQSPDDLICKCAYQVKVLVL